MTNAETSSVIITEVIYCQCDNFYSDLFMKELCGNVKMEQFIHVVKNNPALYDFGHPDYTNKEARCRIWTKICNDCGFPSEKAAKVEWKRLRDTFRLCLNKPNGHQKNGKIWKYYNIMTFLTPFMSRKDKQNESGIQETNEYSMFEHMLAPNIDLTDTSYAEQSYTNDEASYEPPNKTVKFEDEKTTDSALAMSYGTTSLDHFFLSMCETTKHLPGNLQTQVKRKVFQAVIEAEEAYEQAKGFGFTQVSECNSSSNCEDWPTLYVSTEDQTPDESTNNSKENN